MPANDALALGASVEGQIGDMISFVTFPLIVAARRQRFPLWAAIVLLAAVPVILIGGSFGRIFLLVGWAGVVVGVTTAALRRLDFTADELAAIDRLTS